MRIGIDGVCLANRRGFGRFTRGLVASLAEQDFDHEVLVFVDGPSVDRVSVPSRFQTVVVGMSEPPSRAAAASGRRKMKDMLAMSRAMARARLDVAYFPATYSFVPTWSVGRVVVTMHDTLALAHPELVFPNGRGRLAWMVKEHAAARWADRIVTVSETSRRALRNWFGLPNDRFAVVTEGPDPVFRALPSGDGPSEPSRLVLERVGLKPGDRFLIYVGGLSPHKNLIRLVEAFALATAEHPDVRLVLVGDFQDVFHTHVPEIREAIDRLGLGDRVHLPGFVADDDLVFLYNNAYCLVQPSRMEGFGLPVVEAMACGTPVVVSTAGSLPEVAGEAGLFFDPTDTQAIANAIQTILNDPVQRDQLAQLALTRATLFSWSAAAQALLACLEDVSGATERKQAARAAS